jgi:hypothetical protein
LYTTIEGYACSLDQFQLVAATRQHLITLLGGNGRDASFAGLKLQHTLRSTIISGSRDPIFRNGTRAVFVGRALYYNETGVPSADEMRDMQNLCFLGENQTAYVDSLKQLGCTTLEQALLISSAGQGVVLSKDDDDSDSEQRASNNNVKNSVSSEGKDSPSSSKASNTPATKSENGNDDTSSSSKSDIILITVIALLVPVSLLLFLLVLYIVRQQIENRINWEAIKKVSSANKDQTYWRADHPMALERMKVISSGFEPEVLESSKCISTDDSGSSSAILAEEQEQQRQQTRSSPQRSSSPQRRLQQSRLALELASSEDSSSGQDEDDESAEICSTSSITVHV